MTPEQEARLNEVYAFFKTLQAGGTLTHDFDVAITDRLKRKAILGLTVSAKGVDTEDQTVQESGSSTYSVMGDPDLFLQVSIGGTTYYLPAFT